jgi:peptidoglycan hydrolase CwlO-like protein
MDLKPLLDELKTGLIILAKDHLVKFKKDAVSVVEARFEASRTNLETWMNQLSTNELNLKEFKSLLKGEKTLLEMEKVAVTAEAKAAADKFRDAAFGLIVSVAKKALPI